MTRQEQRQETRDKIINETTTLVTRKGFIEVSTNEIASACDVSQGTIFLHFGTKNNLLLLLLESNVNQMINDLVEGCNPTEPTDSFTKEFLLIVMKYENFLSRAYKDYAYFPESHQKLIDDLEALIKNKFFDNLKAHRSTQINIIDSFILIDAFVSQIKSYLLEKNIFTSSNSVIRQRRGRLLKLYRMLFHE